MAAQTLPLTLEEFHSLYDGAKPAYEYWYGKALQKSMPTFLHSLVQGILVALLREAGWLALPELRLKVVPDVEPVPDVTAIREKPKGRYPTSAPDLCIEILSPGDSVSKAFQKGVRYIEWGTRSVWIIDPENRTAWTLSNEGSPEPTPVLSDGFLRIGDTAIGLAAIFAEVDRDCGDDASS